MPLPASPHRRIAASLVLISAASANAFSQGSTSCLPDVPNPAQGLEEIASFGHHFAEQDARVFETDIAAGPRTALVVYINQIPGGAKNLGWAFRDSTGTWTYPDAILPTQATDASGTFAIQGLGDPSVVYDVAGETSGADGGFLCAAIAKVTGGSNEGVVIVNRYTPGSGWNAAWTVLDRQSASYGVPVDKAFIVAGEPDEFYVTWWEHENATGNYRFARTTNGGSQSSDWTVGAIANASGSPFNGLWAPQPAVYSDKNLYVLHVIDTVRFRILKGTDQAGGGVSFKVLQTRTPNGNTPLLLEVEPDAWHNIHRVAPGITESGFMPQLEADPTNPNRLYIAYQDVDPVDDDMDVFVNTINRVGNAWFFGTPTQLPSPTPTGCNPLDEDSDQIQPALSVDGDGRVHVLYYDDRDFCQPDSEKDFAKYDVVYAASCNGGQAFSVAVLKPAASNGPALLDYDLEGPGWDVREYNGLAWSVSPTGTLQSWGAFTGTSLADPDVVNRSVIYSLQLDF